MSTGVTLNWLLDIIDAALIPDNTAEGKSGRYKFKVYTDGPGIVQILDGFRNGLKGYKTRPPVLTAQISNSEKVFADSSDPKHKYR